MSLRSETGVTLTLVLILLTSISFISVHLLLQTILQGKMVNSFQHQLQEEVKSENQLICLEDKLLNNPLLEYCEPTKKIHFVPDHLAFGCVTGAWIFKNTIPLAESFVAVQEPLSEPLFSYNSTNYLENTPEIAAFFSKKLAENLKLMDVQFLDMLFIRTSKQKWDHLPGYTAFKNQIKAEEVFVLANQGSGEHERGFLFQIELNTGKILQSYPLPFRIKTGYLAASSVFYANAWRSFLAVTISEKEKPGSALLIFDITVTLSPLSACIHMDNTTVPHLANKLSRASFLRFKNGDFYIGIGGLLNNKGVLQIYSLQTKGLSMQIEFGPKPISYLQAIDLHTRAEVNRIYCSDNLHCWAIDLNNINKPLCQNLAVLPEVSFDMPMSLLVTKAIHSKKHSSSIGVNIYFLGKDKSGEGLFMIHDPLNSDIQLSPKENVPQCIFPGSFHTLYIRFGRLLLIPRQAPDPPVVINVANHQPIKIQWGAKMLNQEAEVRASIFLWDPKQRKDILFTLCKDKVYQFKTQLNLDKYGRTAWRNLANE